MKTEPSSLQQLLEAIEFSQHDAASSQGAHHQVFVSPRLSEREGHFDVLVTISPHNTGEAPPSEQPLAAIPRSGFPAAIVQATTNSRGQAWLRELPFGNYALTVAPVARLGTEPGDDKLGQSHDETTPMPLRFERAARDPLRRAAANPEHQLASCLTGAPMSGPIRVSDLTITNEAGAASFAESVLLEIRAGVAHFTIPAGLSVKLDDCPYTHGEELRKDLVALSRMRVEFVLDEISGPMLVFLPLPTN